MIPFISVFIGLLIYWYSFGWHLTFEPSAPLFISATFVVAGLLVYLGTRSQKYY